jgi:hypothetical protein
MSDLHLNRTEITMVYLHISAQKILAGYLWQQIVHHNVLRFVRKIARVDSAQWAFKRLSERWTFTKLSLYISCSDKKPLTERHIEVMWLWINTKLNYVIVSRAYYYDMMTNNDYKWINRLCLQTFTWNWWEQEPNDQLRRSQGEAREWLTGLEKLLLSCRLEWIGGPMILFWRNFDK